MKITTSIVKSILNGFSRIVQKNRDIRKYLFTISLKDELISFYDNEYYQGFSHLNKAISLAKKYCSVDDIIIDVGGADGVTPKILSKAFPLNKIYVFEPIKENYTLIGKILNEFPNIILIPKAAGSKEGKTIINKAASLASSSIFELNIDPESIIFAENLKTEGKEDIEITTIENSVPSGNVAIMKIDVQGFELEVLKGSGKILKTTRLIVLEMNNHDGYKGAPKYFEIDEYLRNNNFVLFDIFPSLKDEGRLKEWDSIYYNNAFLK